MRGDFLNKNEGLTNSLAIPCQRILTYLTQVDDPYSFNMEGYHVEMEWVNTNITLQKRLEELFASF